MVLEVVTRLAVWDNEHFPMVFHLTWHSLLKTWSGCCTEYARLPGWLPWWFWPLSSSTHDFRLVQFHSLITDIFRVPCHQITGDIYLDNRGPLLWTLGWMKHLRPLELLASHCRVRSNWICCYPLILQCMQQSVTPPVCQCAHRHLQ